MSLKTKKLVKCIVGSVTDIKKRKELFNIVNYDSLTCLYFANTGTLLDVEGELMGYLFAKGTDVNIGDTKSGRTILHCAVERNDIEMVTILLTHPSIDINCKTYKGETPILLAYWKNYKSITKRLKAMFYYYYYIAAFATLGIMLDKVAAAEAYNVLDDEPVARPSTLLSKILIEDVRSPRSRMKIDYFVVGIYYIKDVVEDKCQFSFYRRAHSHNPYFDKKFETLGDEPTRAIEPPTDFVNRVDEVKSFLITAYQAVSDSSPSILAVKRYFERLRKRCNNQFHYVY